MSNILFIIWKLFYIICMYTTNRTTWNKLTQKKTIFLKQCFSSGSGSVWLKDAQRSLAPHVCAKDSLREAHDTSRSKQYKCKKYS